MDAFKVCNTGLITVRNLTPHTIPEGLPIYCHGSPGPGEEWVIENFEPNATKVLVNAMATSEADRIVANRKAPPSMAEIAGE